MKSNFNGKLPVVAAATILWAAMAPTTDGQTATNPVSNRVISWHLDAYGTINPTDLAGLAPATNWVDTGLNDLTTNLPDSTGTATTMNLVHASYDTYEILFQQDPGYDADGTANKKLLNGYLNAGPASWGPSITNGYVELSDIPYTNYDVVAYFSSALNGVNGSISDGVATNYYSIIGPAEVSGSNALFAPTAATSNTQFPGADFAFFPGLTNSSNTFTTYPLSGNDNWLGLAGIQVIQASNVYVLYGPAPANLTVVAGQPASFSVMAGGLNPQFQWQHGGTNIPLATNATYSIAAATAGQVGAYDVIVSNSFSAVTSVLAELTFGAPQTLTWNGVGSTWDTSLPYWNLSSGGSATNYSEGDSVRFDALGAAQSTVSLSGVHRPGAITVSNASYTLTSGGLAGGGSLRLMSNATLILDTADSCTGPTVIDSGSTLQLDNSDTAGSLGSGPLTNNGALVFNSSGDAAYAFPVYGSGNVTNISSGGTFTLGGNLNASDFVQAGAGAMILGGTNNSWKSLTIGAGTLQIGQGGTNGSLGAGIITNSGALAIDLAGNLVVTNPITGGGALNQIGSGTVTLTADNNAAAFTGAISVSNGTLLVNGTSGPGSVTVTGGALGGTGTIGGPVVIQQGATLLPGGTATVGTLTISGDLNFGGNVAVKLHKPVPTWKGRRQSPPQANDLVVVTGALNNTSNGTVTVTNLGPALAAGDKFTLFSKPVNGGNTLTIIGGNGVVWTNNLAVDGSISVQALSSAVVHPLFQKISRSGANLVFSGTGGDANGPFNVLSTTNLAQGPWMLEAIGHFDASGNFSVTNNISPGVPHKFYKLQVSSVSQVFHPLFQKVSQGGTNLVFSGTGGGANGLFNVLSTTNLARGQWMLEGTGHFDGSGNFSVTNGIPPGVPETFYKLQLP